LRVRRGWRQADAAAEAGVSRSQVGRLERGDSRQLPLGVAERVADALGAQVELRLRWRGEGLDRLLDEAHARLVELLVRRLRALGWDVGVEVSFSSYGERGSIDVLAWHPVHRALAVFEVKSVTPDMQAMLGGLDRKARLAPLVARDRGWSPVAVVARFLVIGDSRTNRRRVEDHAATVAAALPAGTREVRSRLADPRPPGIGGVWFLPDVQGAGTTAVRRHRVRRRRDPVSVNPDGDPDNGPPGGR
jgi:transcriptional regulator with XRE-family HTH domain